MNSDTNSREIILRFIAESSTIRIVTSLLFIMIPSSVTVVSCNKSEDSSIGVIIPLSDNFSKGLLEDLCLLEKTGGASDWNAMGNVIRDNLIGIYASGQCNHRIG